MPDASTSSRATGNCAVRSSGCASRVRLVVARRAPWRKVGPGASNTTAIAVGRSSRSSLPSICAKPWSALGREAVRGAQRRQREERAVEAVRGVDEHDAHGRTVPERAALVPSRPWPARAPLSATAPRPPRPSRRASRSRSSTSRGFIVLFGVLFAAPELVAGVARAPARPGRADARGARARPRGRARTPSRGRVPLIVGCALVDPRPRHLARRAPGAAPALKRTDPRAAPDVARRSALFARVLAGPAAAFDATGTWIGKQTCQARRRRASPSSSPRARSRSCRRAATSRSRW